MLRHLHRIRAFMSISHPYKMTSVGTVTDDTLVIGRIVLYIDNSQDRLELIFNMTGSHNNKTHWLGNNARGVVKRATLFTNKV
jgi:hypothetical protein